MAALLSLHGVSKRHLRGVHQLDVLRDVSLTLAAGDFVAVHGPRSAGKTTLLRIAAGLQAPDAGTVRFDGRDLATLTAAELAHLHRSEIGWVDRGGPLGDELTVRDWVALPLLGRHAHRRAALLASDALARVGADACAEARWAELADAERMQVALAHGLVREPRLLVLDDPTAGLDVIDRERLLALLRTLADRSRVAVLMAVPDMPSMLHAHDVRALSGGRLLAAPAAAPARAPAAPPGYGALLDFPGGEALGVMLELRDVVKHHAAPGGETIRAVDGVSTSVAAGELVALYGPSGSGKSTLLQLIAALLEPDRGAVLVNGRDVTRLSAREGARYRRLELGFVRQELDMLEGVSALDNATLKLLGARIGWREARRRVTPLMLELGLGNRLSHRAEELSVGERQRVLIARALSTRPGLVLADEPTGSLDTERSREVLTLLTSLCREHGVAMLLVTHDPQAAAHATRVHTLRDGRLHDFEAAAQALPAGERA